MKKNRQFFLFQLLWPLLVLFLVCLPGPSFAQEPADDLDDFFEEDSGPLLPEIEPQNPETEPARYTLTGSLDLATGYRLNHEAPRAGQPDQRGWSDFKAVLDLEAKARLIKNWEMVLSGTAGYNLIYELKGRQDYSGRFLDENESDLMLGKAFLRGSLTRNLDLKVGRQIVIWGKSDNIRVTDILNPLDLREPGKTDIEDLRLPVLMTRLDYYVSNLTFTGYLIHEHRFNRLPVYKSPYYYLPYEMPGDIKPAHSFDHTEVAFSMAANFTGMDISFYFADIYDNTAHVQADGRRHYSRIKMAGLALNKAAGNFLYKTEAAVFDGIRLSAVPTQSGPVENSKDYSRVDYLAGLEYSGFKNSTISYEIADKWLPGHDTAARSVGIKEHTIQHALRLTRTWFNEVLEMSALASLYGEKADKGGFIRLQAAYDITDNTTLILGGVDYKSGPGFLLSGIDENDMIFLKICFGF